MLARKRSTGNAAPAGHRRGQKKRLSEKHRKWLLKTVLAEPDIMLADLQECLEKEKNISASVPTLSRELRRLRFLDEAGAATILTRLYARAIGGRRTTESVPRNYGASTSMIAALGTEGIEAAMTISGRLTL